MGYIAETGMAAFHFDSKNKPAESMAAVDGEISLVGNVNNPQTLYSKGPDEVRAEVWENLEAGVQMVGPECAIPLQTPIENLRAIRDTRRSNGTRRQPARATERTTPMAELSDVTNELHPRGDRRVRRAPRRARAPDRRCSRGARPQMQAIAAALIDGEDDDGRRADARGARRRASRRSR